MAATPTPIITVIDDKNDPTASYDYKNGVKNDTPPAELEIHLAGKIYRTRLDATGKQLMPSGHYTVDTPHYYPFTNTVAYTSHTELGAEDLGDLPDITGNFVKKWNQALYAKPAVKAEERPAPPPPPAPSPSPVAVEVKPSPLPSPAPSPVAVEVKPTPLPAPSPLAAVPAEQFAKELAAAAVPDGYKPPSFSQGTAFVFNFNQKGQDQAFIDGLQAISADPKKQPLHASKVNAGADSYAVSIPQSELNAMTHEQQDFILNGLKVKAPADAHPDEHPTPEPAPSPSPAPTAEKPEDVIAAAKAKVAAAKKAIEDSYTVSEAGSKKYQDRYQNPDKHEAPTDDVNAKVTALLKAKKEALGEGKLNDKWNTYAADVNKFKELGDTVDDAHATAAKAAAEKIEQDAHDFLTTRAPVIAAAEALGKAVDAAAPAAAPPAPPVKPVTHPLTKKAGPKAGASERRHPLAKEARAHEGPHRRAGAKPGHDGLRRMAHAEGGHKAMHLAADGVSANFSNQGRNVHMHLVNDGGALRIADKDLPAIEGRNAGRVLKELHAKELQAEKAGQTEVAENIKEMESAIKIHNQSGKHKNPQDAAMAQRAAPYSPS